MKNRIDELISSIRNLTKQTENIEGGVMDADTVLADVLFEIESEVSGTAEELFQIYENSKDKTSLESFFQSLTGVTLEEFLSRSEAALIHTMKGPVG